MAMSLGLFFVLFIAFASDMKIVSGKQCSIDITSYACDMDEPDDLCILPCQDAVGGHVDYAECKLRNDGSTYCRCLYTCKINN
ncbi:unnamed protein product [Withania somnifera]